MDMPSIVPAEATSLDVRKRKHSEIVDLTGDTVATDLRRETSPTIVTVPVEEAALPDNEINGQDEDTNSDNDEVDDKELYEDMLDQIEDAQFVNGTMALYLHCNKHLLTCDTDGSGGLSVEQVAALQTRLRSVGVEKFFEETIEQKGMDPRHLGVAFGIPSTLDVDDDMYLRLLGLAVVRFFCKRRKLQDYNTVDDAAQLLKRSHNIMVITGAGISTSLGIPDFRSKGTGFYDKVREMGIEEPEEVFDIHNFDERPDIFYGLAGDILPKQDRFTPTHAFIRLLQDKDRLQTNYTQNIDNLEELAGIDANRLIQCHGSFATATCRKCKYKVKGSEIFDDIRAKRIAQCTRCIAELNSSRVPERPQKRSKSRSGSRYSSADDEDEDDDIPQPGVMKPDITFFGEQLPNTFFDRFGERDAAQTDLVIVIGTSLKVAPVSEMPNYLPHGVPHIYISREPIRHVDFDIQLLGNCDDVVYELSRRAGWELKHEMLPTSFVVDVIQSPEDAPHFWRIAPREHEAQDTGSKSTSEDDGEDTVKHKTPAPSSSGSALDITTDPINRS